jgi:Ca2+-binding EF-hand superfamily protein
MKNSGFIQTLLVVGLLGAFTAAPRAQQEADPAARAAQLEKRFKDADKNGDGKLTREEAEAGMPRVFKNFDAIDKDKKGYVTVEDIKAAFAALRKP